MIRVGVFLGNISGPGSGSWNRLVGLVRSIPSDAPVHFHVFAPRELAGDFPSMPIASVHAVERLNKLQRLLVLRENLNDLVERYQLDVLQVETPPVPRNLTCPVLFVLHDIRDSTISLLSPRKLFGRILSALSAHRSAVVIAPSESARREIARALRVAPGRVEVIPAAVDFRERRPSESGGGPLEPYALALGHIERRKNLSVLVRAAQHPLWPRGVLLRIAGGDHGERKQLERIARESPCGVEFLGRVTDAEKWSLLSSAAVVLIPSLVEGFGIVATEGVVAGTPVLVADRTALPEVVGVEEGVLPAKDPAAWAAAVRDLISHAESRERLLSEEREHMQQFAPSVIAQKLVSLYQSVAERKTGT